MNDKDSTDVYNIMIKIFRNNIPFLDTTGRVGNTGYVDYIKDNELTHPIMKSYDTYNRRMDNTVDIMKPYVYTAILIWFFVF
tara:strand:- start:1275 stop:1520 length:246 start_codon:yes stop_codon:yes gene_type:complete